LERLDRETCVQLLAGESVGRVVVVRGGSPEIFPVNYAMDGEAIVFRTDVGTKLLAGPRSPACFEIDHIDHDTREGWSVVAFGQIEEVTRFDTRTWARVHQLAVVPWAGGTKDHWLRLAPGRITGRRIGD
jgi:nitroimidazol reductase NimA-like FMN-containing flavoprotein (pyridoxamine 5'-phosphate oxidase superfamily)